MSNSGEENWYMLTLVGKDRAGIVAQVTAALFDGGCHLGESSMIRLGSSFTIMMMVGFTGSADALQALLQAPTSDLGLHVHVDDIEPGLHQHREPDVRITVYSADRAGIVAQVTGALADAGLEILDLTSDVGGSENDPIYIMHIEGCASRGVETLSAAMEAVRASGIDAHISPIDIMLG